jgi:hypothetical protein
MRLALADALHFRRVQGIDFGSALTLIFASTRRERLSGGARTETPGLLVRTDGS